jgi:hypothetical protein
LLPGEEACVAITHTRPADTIGGPAASLGPFHIAVKLAGAASYARASTPLEQAT